jgi:hypothetical protein
MSLENLFVLAQQKLCQHAVGLKGQLILFLLLGFSPKEKKGKGKKGKN